MVLLNLFIPQPLLHVGFFRCCMLGVERWSFLSSLPAVLVQL